MRLVLIPAIDFYFMDRTRVKVAVNTMMLLAVASLMITGFLMSPFSFRLGLRFRGPEIVNLHDFSSISFIFLLAIHLYLNLGWFKGVLFRKK